MLYKQIIIPLKWPEFVIKACARAAMLYHIRNADKNNIQLELVFVKHYAPNICLSPNVAKFAVS